MAQVLLLTAPEQAADLAFLLEEEGHEPRFWPVLEAPPELPAGLRAVAEHVHRLTWVVVIGRAPLRAFLEAINRAGTRRAIGKLQWLAADAATARAIARQGGLVRVPGDGKWTSAVSGLLTKDDEVLVLHAGQAPEILLDSLDAAGVGFTQVAVPPLEFSGPLDSARGDRGGPLEFSGPLDSARGDRGGPLEFSRPLDSARGDRDLTGVVIVHSAAAAEAFVELTLGLPAAAPDAPQCCGPLASEPHAPRPALPAGMKIVASTPEAAAALEALGVEVYVTASTAAADAVVDAALRALSE